MTSTLYSCRLVLCHFRRLAVRRRFVLGRLAGAAMRDYRVRLTRRGIVRLMRFSGMRTMGNHRFVTFREQAE
jgi:hypothetical protein